MDFNLWPYGRQPQQALGKPRWRGRFVFAFLWWGALFAFSDVKYFFTVFIDLSFIGAFLLAMKKIREAENHSIHIPLDKPTTLFLLFCGCCPSFFLLLASFAQFVPVNFDLAGFKFSDVEWGNMQWAVMFLLSLLGVISGAVVLLCDYHAPQSVKNVNQAFDQNDRDQFF